MPDLYEHYKDPESQKSNRLIFLKFFVLSNQEFKHTSNAESLICLLIEVF